MKSLYAKIEKRNIDVAKRLVTGIAQLEDQPDHQGDVVDFDASLEAFGNWVGNVREMHVPKAVGKCVNWRADEDSKSIFVTTHISKGAEDTWQKILDGTLTGYSIGGHELSSKQVIDKSSGRKVNRITKYVLTELSLVDSPANPKCVITAIHKRNGGLEATGVLDTLGGVSMKTRPIKKANAAVREVAKTLGDGDEIFILKRSDVERVDGKIMIKSTAVPGIITKDDASDAGMMSDSDDTQADDSPARNDDLEDHATSAAQMHKGLCDMVGIEDHKAHYDEATGDKSNAKVDDDHTATTGNDIEMGRRTGNLRKGMTPSAIQKLVKEAVGSEMTTLAKSFDDLKTLVTSGALAPRKDGAAGVPIAKTIDAHLNTSPTGESTDAPDSLAGQYQTLQKRYDEAVKRGEALIAKSRAGVKLTPDEEVEKGSLSKSLTKMEVEMSDIRKRGGI